MTVTKKTFAELAIGDRFICDSVELTKRDEAVAFDAFGKLWKVNCDAMTIVLPKRSFAELDPLKS